MVLGQVVLEWVPDETGAELKQYLEGYLSLSGESASAAAALPAALVLYIRYPLLAFFLGFAFHRVVLLPCAALGLRFSCLFPCAALPLLSAVTAWCWPWRCWACAVP